MSFFKQCIIAAIAVFSVSGTANATMITDQVTFSATGFFGLPGLSFNPPVGTVTGSFDVTYDTATQYFTPVFSGLSLNSLNLNPISAPLGFTRIIVGSTDIFDVGSVNSGIISALAGINSFALQILNLQSAHPILVALEYSEAGTRKVFTSLVGTVSVTQLPLPAGFPLFAAALGAWGLFSARNRKRSVMA